MILGLRGDAGCGKGYVADLLRRRYSVEGGVKIHIVSLADPIKRTVRDWFPQVSDEMLWGGSDYRNAPLENLFKHDGSPLTARHLLQQLGTDFGRSFWEDVWVEKMIRTATLLEQGGLSYDKSQGLSANVLEINPARSHVIIVDDVRFPNEIRAIKRMGGAVWLIEAPKSQPKAPSFSALVRERAKNLFGGGKNWRGHASETASNALPRSLYDGILSNGKQGEAQVEAEIDRIVRTNRDFYPQAWSANRR